MRAKGTDYVHALGNLMRSWGSDDEIELSLWPNEYYVDLHYFVKLKQTYQNM